LRLLAIITDAITAYFVFLWCLKNSGYFTSRHSWYFIKSACLPIACLWLRYIC